MNHVLLPLLRCPRSKTPLKLAGGTLQTIDGEHTYQLTDSSIPLFAETFLSADAKIQQQHYDKIATSYTNSLNYPHTIAYTQYLDNVLNDAVQPILETSKDLGICVEVCCGTGEAMSLYREKMALGVAVDISLSMLEKGQAQLNDEHVCFIQADATNIPLDDQCADNVIMLGGIHHVPNRQKLFEEIYRVLKPGGYFIFREPVSDFYLWKILRAIIYRLSSSLDHETERPLTFDETVPVLKYAGFSDIQWRTCGFLGFCLLMNSDVLVFNRLLRHVPGIKRFANMMARFDEWCVSFPKFKSAGLQVVSRAKKGVS